jgi:hypothetical protein
VPPVQLYHMLEKCFWIRCVLNVTEQILTRLEMTCANSAIIPHVGEVSFELFGLKMCLSRYFQGQRSHVSP